MVKKLNSQRLFVYCGLLTIFLMLLPFSVSIHDYNYELNEWTWDYLSCFNPEVIYHYIFPCHLAAAIGACLSVVTLYLWGMEPGSMVKTVIQVFLAVMNAVGACTALILAYLFGHGATVFSYLIFALLLVCLGCRIRSLARRVSTGLSR